MDPILSPIIKSLSNKFVSQVTNSKTFRDLKATWSKDNYSQKTLNIFSAAIADAKATIQLPDNLLVELLEDPDNRAEIFRWIFEGTEPGKINKDRLVLDPYIERFPRYQDQLVPFFSIILDKLNEYKKIHWDPSDLELINRMAQLHKGLSLIEDQQNQAIEISNNINQTVEEIKASLFDPNITFLAQLTSMLQSNNLQSAERQLASIIRMLSNAHQDQDWNYEVSIDGSEVTILEKPQNVDIIEGLEKRMEVKIVIPQEYKHFQNLGEIIQYGRNKQVTVELELQEFKLYAGDHLFEKKKSTLERQLVMSIPPIPFPIIKTTLIIGDEVRFDVWMQIIEVIEDDVILISNKNQPEREIEYKFKYNIKTQESSNFDICIPEERKQDVNAHLQYTKGIVLAQEGTSLKMVYADNIQNICFSSKISISNQGKLDDKLIKVLEMLFNIETFFGVTFELPEQIGTDDITIIAELERIISTNSETIDLEDYTIVVNDFKLLNQFIDSLESGSPILFKGEGHRDFSIFGITFVIEIDIQLPPVGIKNVEMIKNKVKVLSEGDSLSVTFIPFEQSNKSATYHYVKSSYIKNGRTMINS
ncbi:hypothetical protein M4D81_26280 [Paenibacillus sp. p3-SID867]|uniref:hypothetical protein n=1 Tax=Paenibacillus sp. p3-SID867 TaxID=2916363 RepID=UPI0021A3EAA4|nr:hypothetical protein [Paenibacillus sp. p3-SID867]MCT1402501.1 hypothetical protein [Paenibacillus sp. p3-SID867]